MSWISDWIDKHITHKTEMREAREKADAQLAEYQAQQKRLQEERDKLKAQADYERERMQRKQMRRLKSGIRQRSFTADDMNSAREALG